MDYKTFLTAAALDHKMELIDKAIEYMETVPTSTECHDAIVDMLKYEKEGIAENFRQLTCDSCIENCKKAQCGNQGEGSIRHNNIDLSKVGSKRAPEVVVKPDSREVDEVFC